MSNGTRITIDSITYEVFNLGENIHGLGTCLCLSKIGKRGKATKVERLALLRPDGSLKLQGWM